MTCSIVDYDDDDYGMHSEKEKNASLPYNTIQYSVPILSSLYMSNTGF